MNANPLEISGNNVMMRVEFDGILEPALGFPINEPLAIVESMQDDPAEAIAFALAHAVFELRFGVDISLQLDRADAIRRRLAQLGFKIVRDD